MPHRQAELSDEERAFVTDPETFLKNNLVIVRSPGSALKRTGMQYWSLIPAQTGEFETSTNDVARKNNRRGRQVPCFNLRQVDTGAIHAYYVHWQQNSVVSGTLGVAATDADFFITATMNGCSFSFAQNGPDAAGLVAHHNDIAGSGRADVIEAQDTGHGVDSSFFHQADYRKIRSGAVDNRYYATVVGKRGADRIWRFYSASRKLTAGDTWSLKGVKVVNP